MNTQEFINAFRQIISDLIELGIKKTHIKGVLVPTSMNQFYRFIENDIDISLAALNKMLNNVGYELHVVPLKKDCLEDNECKEVMDKINNIASDALAEISEILESRAGKETKSRKKILTPETEEYLNDLLDQFIK